MFHSVGPAAPTFEQVGRAIVRVFSVRCNGSRQQTAGRQQQQHLGLPSWLWELLLLWMQVLRLLPAAAAAADAAAAPSDAAAVACASACTALLIHHIIPVQAYVHGPVCPYWIQKAA